MSGEKFIDPNSVVGVAQVDQDMARIKQAVRAQDVHMIESAVKEMLRVEKRTFETLLALGLKSSVATPDAELNESMRRLPKVSLPTAEGWLISMLAIYGWNRMAEEISNDRRLEATLSDQS